MTPMRNVTIMAIMGRVTSADMESMIADITTVSMSAVAMATVMAMAAVSITAADIDYYLKECSSIIKYVMMGPHSF